MNNFGVIEVASTRTTNAPGWAYVPDTRPHPNLTSSATTQSRKRARNTGANLSYADLNARQEAKIRKELEVLDRDNSRDVVIPIPPKSGGSSRAGQGKHTPNVRKILLSQKTFANHLDDFIALGDGGAGAASNAPGTGASRSAAAAATAAISRAKGAAQQQQAQKKPDASSSRPAGKQPAVKEDDTEMTDASEPTNTILQSYAGPTPAAHPSDNDPLLVSRVPPLPSDEELRAFTSTPPLSYLEARAGWNEEDKKYPVRVFCEVCGYWGRVKCMKCGVKVCALECLETHREECVTRYGL